MMTERIFHGLDTIVATVATTIVTGVTALLGTIRPYNPDDQLMQTLLPLIGVTFVGCGAFLLNPQVETRRIVLGRICIASFFGLVTPSTCIAIAPNIIPDWGAWIVEVMHWPMPMIGMGGISTGIFYILSRPFFARAYDRADAIAAEQVRRLEMLAQGPNNTVVVLNPNTVNPSAVSKIITEKLTP